MKEEWKDLKGELDGYAISSFGRLKSKERIVKRSDGVLTRYKEKFLKGNPHSDGYIRYSIKRRQIFAHVLVLENFVCKRPFGLVCCHIDGNPRNNSVENLRWATQKENSADRVLHGTHQIGEKNHRAKLSNKDVDLIRQGGLSTKTFAFVLGVNPSTISNINTGKKWGKLKAGWSVKEVDLS